MKIIGLCGGSGSGKGTVCSIFNELGIKSIDTDQVYHDMISSESDCVKELISAFGKDIYTSFGIDRKKLRDIVFSSEKYLNTLNEITHKHILNTVRYMIDDYRSDPSVNGVIIDAPLLFESGFNLECDVTVCVIADTDTRIKRIISRDGISYQNAYDRIKSQISNDELILKCDYFIENDSSIDSLRSQITTLYKRIFET